MKKLLLILISIWAVSSLNAQEGEWYQGSVTFTSAANVYVRFESTRDIKEGDTLYVAIEGKRIAALQVKKKSSLSCVTVPLLTGRTWLTGETVSYFKKAEAKATAPVVPPPIVVTEDNVSTDTTSTKNKQDKIRKPLINGRFSASTNASLTDGEDYQRIRLGLTFNVNNIGGGYFSTQNYITYRHRYGVDQQTGFYDDFKIYALALGYDRNGHSVYFGRRISNRIANLGAIDGLQYEKKSGNWVAGAFAGSRPDHINYTFNPDLLQGGILLGYESQGEKSSTQTSVAWVEQRNSGKTDRRFAYMQHNSSLGKRINIFGSLEMDMYQNVRDTIQHKLQLTGAYFSIRFRPIRSVNITASYDNRRNVIFYESQRTYIDQLLNQETRQGYRLQAGWQVWKTININGSVFYRFQENQTKPTKNQVLSLSVSRFPTGNMSLNLNVNTLESYYFKGNIYGARLNQSLLKGRLGLEFNYRRVDYTFFGGEQKLKQDIPGFSANINMARLTTLIFSYEGTFEADRKYHRYFITAIQRFKNK